MNHEIELKLRLNPSELPLLEQALATDPFISEPTLQLLNRYYDTPSMALSQSGAALRIRQQKTEHEEQAKIIQTLKTRGSSTGGLHQRMEWDWPLSEVQLDLGLIEKGDAQQYLSEGIRLDKIEALFTTDFQRKVWMYQADDTLIELVLDCGYVATDEHRIELLELELELKQGKAEVLFHLAQNLAQQCPVVMSDISKAERGYGLLALSPAFEGIKKDWQGGAPEFDVEQDVISAFKTFFGYQLGNLQRTLENTIWDKSDTSDVEILNAQCQRQLLQLKNLLMLFSSIDCLPEAQLLQRQLAQAADAQLEISLIWGQLTLACGHWLFDLDKDGAIYIMNQDEKNALHQHVEQLHQGLYQGLVGEIR